MRVDLEELASGYGHRPASAAALARASRAAVSAEVGAGDLAIDVGGGQGAHAAVWADTGAMALVVDPSVGMSATANRRRGVAALRARSQQLPIRSESARLVYFHLSLHYGDWRSALREAKRVLAPNGECWIWTMGEEHHRASFLARWFPSVGDIDSARFPDPDTVVAELRDDWSDVAAGKERESKIMPAGQWRAAVEARFISTLQLISDEEFRVGLAKYDENHPDPTDSVEYLLTFDWIRARK